MRILIFGGDGMLGHQLYMQLRDHHDVRVTLRGDADSYARFNLFTPADCIAGIDVRDSRRLDEALADAAPEAVINAVGIVKQRFDAAEHIPSLEINALFPHKLLERCNAGGIRLVHLSTDCVFSGRDGNYTEESPPDATDLYGRTKLLGEVGEGMGITLRSSIIGLELSRKSGLIEWFLAQRGRIRGFRKAIYTGLTTMEMTRVIERLLMDFPGMNGLWHVASKPIDKYELLSTLSAKLGRDDIEIDPDDAFVCDRSLDGSKFAAATGYVAPSWDIMLTELAGEIRRRGEG